MSKLNVTEWEVMMLKVSQLEQSVMALRGDVEKISAHLHKNNRIQDTINHSNVNNIGFIQGELQKVSSSMLMMATEFAKTRSTDDSESPKTEWYQNKRRSAPSPSKSPITIFYADKPPYDPLENV